MYSENDLRGKEVEKMKRRAKGERRVRRVASAESLPPLLLKHKLAIFDHCIKIKIA